ncbi:MAG: Transketolase [Candidatus Giovannonibacteria bacterium GW2011_GWB1_45_9b]|uniref:Transketolase n=6 Tax=Candidatus Giovannoniibacteriota TaxID=1752738 RepID=A0A1F5X1Q2_9BACT|nr:MAG: Transketolase [Candidatus Giovannonibacteria bacterium GW2011_GWA2_44_26]KKU16817.1 MAG: Transketolase [Candidatus Giovannonibacteria bacterium GW2011_GWB1_45_9b]OGF73751.1 MAG: transketolase [Candidatus Giovannonibacteria bacterium RIFCSPHIGHO2_02_43_16]OGF81825.1 MAG: transketolase [Candidatus Giovannonibacteria bacterium RIFCSPHIGHO2_12_44_12]OGF85455.1 MAG: transketolase [Candidatus Giovannonibacteria bacterium RIFCSPLOWO2_02_44_8]OGF94827.1 MAG: transketolase [Candidatus Giovannon
MDLFYAPLDEIKKVRKEISDPFLRAETLADIFRINTLYMIKLAGSGHIGTSFSAMDIAAWLWLEEMENPNARDSKDSDIYFSSKGHDIPGLYSILIGLEKIPFDFLHKLRRLNGLPGHPDISIPFIAANTGSLGMGISKARGMALARRLKGEKGRIYVLTGDGELQEGQIWESLHPAANGKFSEITAIVDHNKLQSDNWVKDVSDLGNIEDKFRSFGWEVERCDGHSLREFVKSLREIKEAGIKNQKPQVLIADTIKGKGVSFMEPHNFKGGGYKYHAGAPSDSDYSAAFSELSAALNKKLESFGMSALKFEKVPLPVKSAPKKPENPISAFGEELVRISEDRKDIVVLDADLAADGGILGFKKKFPERFKECGIAEQDMVSVASGLALEGMLPIIHSYSCFMPTRANEQFYNNASEKKKIIYIGTLSGLLPATPGHSHQSVRDISAVGSCPELIMVEPSSEKEARLAIRWAVEQNVASTYIRFSSVSLDLPYTLPENYDFKKGQGVLLKEGKDAAIVAYGQVMLKEAILAAEILSAKGISLAVVNLPWLNVLDREWLKDLADFKIIFTLDDHYIKGGQGEFLAAEISRTFDKPPKIFSFGVEDIPVCGWNDEVLKYHGLDSKSLAEKIEKIIL